MIMAPGCLVLVLILGGLLFWPFLLAHLFTSALAQLGFGPGSALLLLAAMIVGGTINLPLYTVEREELVPVETLGLFGFGPVLVRHRCDRARTIVAVNVGGCVVPVLIALYQIRDLAAQPGGIAAVALATAVNVLVCHATARPVPGLGILLPVLVSPVASVLLAWLLAPQEPVAVAFVAGVLGPLIGADLLNLPRAKRLATGVMSIGGAGTFDAIVLSGVLAAVLAA